MGSPLRYVAIHYGHNCTVGYAEDGEIKFLASEERFCRLKNATGFPFETLSYISETYLGGDLSNIDRVAIVDGSGSRAAQLCKIGLKVGPFLDYYWKNKKKALTETNENGTSHCRENVATAAIWAEMV